MPAPIVASIEDALKQQYISSGKFPRNYVETAPNGTKSIKTDTADLPDSLKKQIHIDALALSQTWAQWQAAQVIAGTDIITGAPITGRLP